MIKDGLFILILTKFKVRTIRLLKGFNKALQDQTQLRPQFLPLQPLKNEWTKRGAMKFFTSPEIRRFVLAHESKTKWFKIDFPKLYQKLRKRAILLHLLLLHDNKYNSFIQMPFWHNLWKIRSCEFRGSQMHKYAGLSLFQKQNEDFWCFVPNKYPKSLWQSLWKFVKMLQASEYKNSHVFVINWLF